MNPGLPDLAADVHDDLGTGGTRGTPSSDRRGTRPGPLPPGRTAAAVLAATLFPVGSRHHLRCANGLGPAHPEVLHGENRGHHEQDTERDHVPPLQPAPRLHPHRHPLPQSHPDPLPPDPGRTIPPGTGLSGTAELPNASSRFGSSDHSGV